MTFKRSPAGYRNVEGTVIRDIQARLNAQGCNAGIEDGVWGKNTENALQQWRTKNNIPGGAEIDDNTWRQLMGSPIPDLWLRALQLTGAWEGTGYGGTNGNGDDQGITWGIVGFTWKNGEIQQMLQDIRTRYPGIFDAVFAGLNPSMKQILAKTLPEQMQWAITISTNKGENIQEPWAAAFKKLGETPEVQDLQNARAKNHYWNTAIGFAAQCGLQNEMGLALWFDTVVQLTIPPERITEIKATPGYANMTESERISAIARILSQHARTKYQQDVRDRKMTFATGTGLVHKDRYAINCWGIG